MHPWEREYRQPSLVTLDEQPTKAVLRFFKWWKKRVGSVEGQSVLDLGCGTGRHALWLAERGAKTTGYDISETAIEHATTRATQLGVQATFAVRSIGGPFPLEGTSMDLVLDITASNALSEAERSVYLAETHRVLKDTGILFVRALCKDGDKNAKNLVTRFPGGEKDTYRMPKTGFVERVWSEQDLRAYYETRFQVVDLVKTWSYTRFDGQSYKRAFWLLTAEKLAVSRGD